MLLQKRVNSIWARVSKNQIDIQYITVFVFITMLASFSFSQVYGQDWEGGDLSGVTLGATNFWNADLSGQGSTIIYDINTFLYQLNNLVQKLW